MLGSRTLVLFVCVFAAAAVMAAGAGAICVDTDGGNDKYVKGHCSDGEDEFDDECTGDEHIEELICEDDICVLVDDLSCPEGTMCEDGACVGPGSGTPYPTAPCVDTDGGSNKAVYGKCTDVIGTYTEECIDKSSIEEFYCRNNRCAMELDDSCPQDTVCSGGKCVQKPSVPPSITQCSDSDGGDNKLVSGVCVDQTKGTTYDACLSSTRISEQICVNNACVPSPDSICPPGMVCSGGACVVAQGGASGTGGSTGTSGGQPAGNNGGNNQGQPANQPAMAANQLNPVGAGGQLPQSSAQGGVSIDPVLIAVIIIVVVVIVAAVVVVIVLVGKKH